MKALFSLFFKIGCTAFGGPLAHIGMVEQEIVTNKKLIDKKTFVNYIGMVNLIPGPNSTQLVLLCGLKLYGIIGMILSGFAFICPAVIITLILAILYNESHYSLEFLRPLFNYLSFGVFPIILFSLVNFIKSSSKNYLLTTVLILSAIINYFINNEILVIFVVGLLGFFIELFQNKKNRLYTLDIILLYTIFYKFIIIGFTLFGGGFLLIAYVKDQFSTLLTNEQILNAIAFGQFTPGPILTSVTFMGYQLAGIWGALIATLGIFLPSLILVPILNHFFSQSKHFWIPLFLNHITASSIGVMTSITIKLGLELSGNIFGIILTIINSLLLYKKIPTPYLIIISMFYGYLIFYIH